MKRRPVIFPGRRLPLILAMLALTLTGCADPPRSTRLTLGDIQETSQRMVASLAGSDWLTGRGPDSPPIRIVIDKVENLTSDVIPEAEQWMYVAKVAGALPVQELGRKRNITFQITPRRQRALEERGFEVDLAAAEPPTHVLTATFLSATRAGSAKAERPADERSDRYYLSYQILDLASREVVWEDRFEFQRAASGLLID